MESGDGQSSELKVLNELEEIQSRRDTHTHTQTQIYIVKHALCVPGGRLRLRKSDLTAWLRGKVQRVAGLRAFLCSAFIYIEKNWNVPGDVV